MWSLVQLGVSIAFFSASFAVEMKKIPVLAVTGVWKGAAALPCDVSHPPEDSIYLLLWFREGLTTPIYRFDDRSSTQGKEIHWSDEKVLGSRASLDVTSSPALLRVRALQREDGGFYRCRVDFKSQPTKTTRVNLTVVVPPDSVNVMVGGPGGDQEVSTTVVGPYQEGDILKLTCIAHGGYPRPSVVWFEGTHLLDSHMESNDIGKPTEIPLIIQNSTADTVLLAYTVAGDSTNSILDTGPLLTDFPDEPFNTLTLGPLTRNDLKLLLTCEASNNNLTLPTSVVVMVDMNLPPLSVTIRAPELPLIAAREYQVVCEVRGSRPPPSITWWSGDRKSLKASKTNSADGNVTTSTLILKPSPEDDGSFLRCVAESESEVELVDEPFLDDVWNLTVHYLPTATARFGLSLDASNIKEGDDVYFECSIQANPRFSYVSWRHNNEALSHNVSAGVIVSNQSLVLQKVVRRHGGLYSCHAHNIIGDGNSNTLRLDVKYAPVCSPGQVTSYAVGRHEDAEVTCSVQANPLQATFQWTFNNTADTIDVPQGRFSSSSSHSVITYTPMTSLDYGTLLCWASNEIGTQKEPCVFHIVPAGKPDPPTNCTVDQRTRTSVRVICVAGSGGGLEQHFFLVANVHNGDHTLNVSNSTIPSFFVSGLKPGQKYHLVITARNDKGTSAGTHLTISSLSSTGSVYQPHDGPSEAEVRDPGKSNGGNGGASRNSGGGATDRPYMALPSLLPAALGVGAGLILIIIVLILLITFRTRRPTRSRRSDADKTTSSGGGGEAESEHPTPRRKSPIVRIKQHDTSCLEREIQVESESELDPDIIPMQEAYRPGERDSSVAATLLPPEHYSYGPAPTHVPSITSPRYSRLAISPTGGMGGPGEHGGGLPVGGGYDSGAFITEHQSSHCHAPRSSTLPRSIPHHHIHHHAPAGTNNIPPQFPPSSTNPHHFIYQGLEGSLPPPPTEYQTSRGKRLTFGRECSHSVCEEDTPSTPLLSKRESSV